MSEISPAAQRYVDAVNAFDIDAVLATFAPEALVNDNHREFADPDSIRAWVAAEIIGDRVTMEVTEAIERSGITCCGPATTATTTRPICPTS